MAFPMKVALMALVLLSLSAADVAAAQLPAAGTLDGLGVNIHGTIAQDLDMMQAAGCKFIRYDTEWDQIETTVGHYNWVLPDGLITACADRGMRLLYILDYGNSLYGTNPDSSSWRQGFANFAAAAAARYAGDGVVWELWNEPNAGLGLPGMSNAYTYMALANKAIPAMRAADPNCTIVAPAFANMTGNTSWLTTCFQKGLLNLVDGVSVHPYQSTPEAVVSIYGTWESD